MAPEDDAPAACLPTEPPADPLDAAQRVGAELEARGIPYAVGGALAYGLWGIPRATVDVDLNVFVTDDRLGEVCAALTALGIEADAEAARHASERQGLYVVRYGMFRVDLFTPSVDFSWEAARTRVRKTIDGRPTWFLSAEALAVFKLLFFRGKDVVDLERLVAVQGDRLDASYVRCHIARMMGEDDERVTRWDELVARHRPSR